MDNQCPTCGGLYRLQYLQGNGSYMVCSECGCVENSEFLERLDDLISPRASKISDLAMQKRQSKDWQIPEPTKVELPQPPGLWERKLELD